MSRETTPDIWNECLKEYRQQILSGKDFKKFLANFIASYHSHPEDSLRYPTSRDYTIASHDHLYDRSGLGQRVPLFFKKWYRPEIKVKNEIGVENIKFVIVWSDEQAGLLEKQGVPKEKIRIIPEMFSEKNEVMRKIYSGEIK